MGEPLMLYRMIVSEVVVNEVAYYVEADSVQAAEALIDEGETLAEIFLRIDRVQDRAFHRDTLQPLEGDVAYMAVALANGWEVVDDESVTGSDTPCLYHADHERSWPLNDWRGACADLGLLD
jgi:hypothetical protein